jgi:hypothetical protein
VKNRLDGRQRTGELRKMCCALRPVCRLPIALRRVHAHGGTNTQHQAELEGTNDARTGMPHGIPRGAMCVQRFDDSLNSAIHTTFRISLRSSSMPEPRDPLLKVVIIIVFLTLIAIASGCGVSCWWASPPRKREVRKNTGADRTEVRCTLIMILPQVHLRKPCYDFYFL